MVTRSRWAVAPYFIVDDVIATADYYRDRLGFTYDRFWGDPPAFCMVERSCVVIMLGQFEESGHMRSNRSVDPGRGAWDAYLWVDDADALHAEYVAKGVRITEPVGDRVYGCRDFEIADCNGYHLCFGHDLSTAAERPNP